MDNIVNNIRAQYKNLQAVPIDKFKMLEEEVKKQGLQILSLEVENRNSICKYNEASITLSQYENNMQAFTDKLIEMEKQYGNMTESFESLKRFSKEKVITLLKEYHTNCIKLRN
jgi:alkyl hydroperoxide reductase subunit AhpC